MCALITDVTGKVKYIQNMGGFPPKNVFAPPPCSAIYASILPWSLTFVGTQFIVVFLLPFLFALTCSRVCWEPAFSLSHGGSWLGCKDLPAMGTVSF